MKAANSYLVKPGVDLNGWTKTGWEYIFQGRDRALDAVSDARRISLLPNSTSASYLPVNRTTCVGAVSPTNFQRGESAAESSDIRWKQLLDNFTFHSKFNF
jgi:hypothetical protein